MVADVQLKGWEKDWRIRKCVRLGELEDYMR
jgi:hypothetical protein